MVVCVLVCSWKVCCVLLESSWMCLDLRAGLIQMEVGFDFHWVKKEKQWSKKAIYFRKKSVRFPQKSSRERNRVEHIGKELRQRASVHGMTFLEGRCFIWVSHRERDILAVSQQSSPAPSYRYMWEKLSKSVRAGGDGPKSSQISVLCDYVASGVCPCIATGLDSCARSHPCVHVPSAVAISDVHGLRLLSCQGSGDDWLSRCVINVSS